MKIETGTQQPALATQTADSRADKIASEAAQQNAPAKLAKPAQQARPARAADKVDLSASLATDIKTQQELQAKRVDAIKTRIKAGTYEVSSHDVAEKMLSGPFDL
jgi:flagellar biosynthesis anti-sigma factor FlgM